MKMSKAVKPISYVKAHAAELVKNVSSTHQPVVITQNGEAKAILQSLSDYEDLQDSLAMLKIVALGKEAVAQGESKPVRTAFADVRKQANRNRADD